MARGRQQVAHCLSARAANKVGPPPTVRLAGISTSCRESPVTGRAIPGKAGSSTCVHRVQRTACCHANASSGLLAAARLHGRADRKYDGVWEGRNCLALCHTPGVPLHMTLRPSSFTIPCCQAACTVRSWPVLYGRADHELTGSGRVLPWQLADFV